MSEEDSKVLAKIGLLVLKTVPSMAIEIGLSEQERLAYRERRLNDLELIRSIRSIKQEVDRALDQWIGNL